jgi:hypothetical protein
MSALIYIIRKSIKNWLRELRSKPGKLVMYIFFAAMLVLIALQPIYAPVGPGGQMPLYALVAAMFSLASLYLFLFVGRGTAEGSTMFDMSDVNLLFVSPVGSRKILMYGLVKALKTAFVIVFFILFQAGTLLRFGIGYGGVVLVFAGFIMALMLLSIVSMLIYILTNGRPRRKLFAKLIAVLFYVPLAIYALTLLVQGHDMPMLAEAIASSSLMSFVPVAGWTVGWLMAALSGDVAACAVFLGANILLGAGVIVYIVMSNQDYYEDVLVATETIYERKRAISAGDINAATGKGRRVRVSRTGIPYAGAATLFGKHLREDFRENRLGFLGISDLVVVAAAIAVSAFSNDMLQTLNIVMWIQIMLIGTGRGLKELYSHYIYMIPERPFRKIVWGNMEIVARELVKSALIFGVSGIATNAGAVHVLMYILAYTLFSFALLGINYVSLRVSGVDVSAGVMIMLYFFVTLLLMAPGAVIAILLGMRFGLSAGLAALCAWELALGCACFALSRGVLHNCDMSTMKPKK